MKKIVFLTMLLMSYPVAAMEIIIGKVTTVEATYMPSRVTFIMDAGNATCAKGAWFTWTNSNEENNKAVYSLLLSALASGKNIKFLIADGDKTCTGKYIYLVTE